MNNKFKQISKIILQKMGMLSFIIGWYNIKRFFQSLKFHFFNGLLTFFPNHPIRVLYLKNIMGIKLGKLSFILLLKERPSTGKIQENMNSDIFAIRGDYNGI